MGYLKRNSETWKPPGFSGFECRVSGIGQFSISGFGSGSGSKIVGLFPWVSGFRVQRPITRHDCHSAGRRKSFTVFLRNILLEEKTRFYLKT